MSDMLKFSLYSVLKNEDAPPYLGEGILIAADGLGGSGSTVHEIDKRRQSHLDEDIRRAAFGDFSEEACEEMRDYLDQLVEPMADGESDTSALWGSRIVIARFLYAVRYLDQFREVKSLRDPAVRERLSAFVSKGLHRVVKEFDLKRGKYDNQLLLPTTLAAVFYEERDSSVVADCIWAGDSRCYALLPSGMKLLTADDEDSSGAITNLFFATEKPTVLHHRRYQLAKPCALLAVSDGVFDPFDPHDYLGVEHEFQTAIAECGSIDELKGRLIMDYDRIHGDDTTIAFQGFGFASYDDLKHRMAPRFKQVSGLLEKWREMHAVLEVINQPEEDIVGYVRTRTSDKYAAIASTLISMILEKKRDVVLRGAISDRVEALRTAITAKQGADRAVEVRSALEEIHAILLDEPQNATRCLTRNKIVFNNGSGSARARFDTNFRRAIETSAQIAVLRRELDELTEKRRCRGDAGAELRDRISERIDYYSAEIDRVKREPIVKAPKKQREADEKDWLALLDLETMWRLIEFDFMHGTVLSIPDKKQKELPEQQRSAALMKHCLTRSTDRALVRELIDYQSERLKLDAAIRKKNGNLNGAMLQYNRAVESFYPTVYKMKNPEVLFQRAFAARMGLLRTKSDANAQIACELEDAIKQLFVSEREAIVGDIVETLAAYPRQTSVIDVNYNGTRLSRFRTYYHCKASSQDDVRAVEGALERMRADHEELLNSDAT